MFTQPGIYARIAERKLTLKRADRWAPLLADARQSHAAPEPSSAAPAGRRLPNPDGFWRIAARRGARGDS
jgi:hypothetical protein